MPNESAYIDTSVEFCSLISKKRRLKEFNQRQAKEILDLFATHV